MTNTYFGFFDGCGQITNVPFKFNVGVYSEGLQTACQQKLILGSWLLVPRYGIMTSRDVPGLLLSPPAVSRLAVRSSNPALTCHADCLGTPTRPGWPLKFILFVFSGLPNIPLSITTRWATRIAIACAHFFSLISDLWFRVSQVLIQGLH